MPLTQLQQEIHNCITGDQYALPIDTSISAQTTGRHIDALEEAGYLGSMVTSSENVNRHLIIGYELTEDGERILDEKRETLLKKIVSRELFTGETNPVETDALRQLVRDEYTAGLAINETAGGYTRRQLLLLLGMYFIEGALEDAFSSEERQRLRNAVQQFT